MMNKCIIDGLAEMYLGDCKEVLSSLSTSSIDLVVTSPPYADRRKNSYGGIAPDDYVAWFLPIAQEIIRILKPSGTFILNIKEKAHDGERHTFVLELILSLRRQGWLWTEEFIWHKKNCYPGKWPNRFRDAWERLLQFNKERNFAMFQESVMIPVGNWSKKRLGNLSETDQQRDNARNNSGFGKKISNWVGRDKVYPTNVLHLATECSNRTHSAVFPESLPAWFINLFTQEGDKVLDPFMGSGTTLAAASRLKRYAFGIEIKKEYYNLAVQRVRKIQNPCTDLENLLLQEKLIEKQKSFV